MWLRRGLAGVIVCLAGILIFHLINRKDNSSPPSIATPSSLSENTDSLIQGFHYRQTKSGAVQWEVEAEKARINETEQKAFLQVVQVKLLKKGENDMIVVADEGVIDTATNNFDLVNQDSPLSITLSSGYTIYTRQIRWVDAQQEFRTQKAVLIQGQGLNITGDGMIGHLDTEDFTILKNVRVDVAS